MIAGIDDFTINGEDSTRTAATWDVIITEDEAAIDCLHSTPLPE
jgi:hypothetical protein